MKRLHLTLAIGDYDHVRDLANGRVQPEGIDLTVLNLQVEEIFFRFLRHQEWDVSELSLAKYAALVAGGDCPFVAIPVFPSRVFRHSALYVREGSGLHHPRLLAGRRVGVPEWAQTAGVYVRGLLQHRYGLRLEEMSWYQAGVNQPGRVEKVELRLPKGMRLTRVPDRSLNEMLLAGDLEAVASARPPRAFFEGGVVRLFEEPQRLEREYWEETGIFPIMHVVVLRRPLVEAHPWVPGELMKAFDEARRRSLERARDAAVSRFPLPWTPDRVAESERLFGGEAWPYGVEPNRATLDAFLQYAFEQGCCRRRLRPEELFAPGVLESFKV